MKADPQMGIRIDIPDKKPFLSQSLSEHILSELAKWSDDQIMLELLTTPQFHKEPVRTGSLIAHLRSDVDGREVSSLRAFGQRPTPEQRHIDLKHIMAARTLK